MLACFRLLWDDTSPNEYRLVGLDYEDGEIEDPDRRYQYQSEKCQVSLFTNDNLGGQQYGIVNIDTFIYTVKSMRIPMKIVGNR